jgi:hypothetical protein
VPSPVTDVSGAEVARLSLVPPVYVRRALAALRKAEAVPAAGVDALLGAAGEEFATGSVGGLGVRDYEHLVSRTSGIPLTVVRAATRGTARFVALARSSAEQGKPRGAVSGRRDPALEAGHALGLPDAWQGRGRCPVTRGQWGMSTITAVPSAIAPSRT